MTTPRPLPRTDYPTDLAALAAGYRHLADLIESGQAPVPALVEVSLWTSRLVDSPNEQSAAARDLMRALGGGKYEKDVDYSPGSLVLTGMCAGLPVRIWVARDAVCERVVVGTETVEVPAQPAVEAHSEVREVVEWRCGSLLDAAAEATDTEAVAAVEDYGVSA